MIDNCDFPYFFVRCVTCFNLRITYIAMLLLAVNIFMCYLKGLGSNPKRDIDSVGRYLYCP